MSHPDLAPEALAGLRHALSGPAPGPQLPDRGGQGAAAAPPLRRAARLRSLADRALDRIADLVARRLAARAEHPGIAARVEELRAELRALGATGTAVLLARAADAYARTEALATTFELLKAEVQALRALLDRLGEGLAPGSGLEAAPARVAELRDRLGALERRVRDLGAPAPAPDVTAPAARAGPAAATARFDYLGFERRFRGAPEEVAATLLERYAELCAGHQPVLDVGCGRGELVGALAAAGVAVTGVELDPAMAAEARAAGRPVAAGDALAHLRALPARSLGTVIAVHVVEHLPLERLVELLELSASRLRPGGILIAETPNPASLVVLGNSYVLDPTHVWPLHPLLLQFLCERAGFRDVEVRYFAPAEGYRLPLIETVPGVAPWIDEVNDRLSRLNATLFGPQEYAVVARVGPAPDAANGNPTGEATVPSPVAGPGGPVSAP